MSTRKILCLAGLTILLGAASLQAQSAISYAVTWNPIADPSVSEILIYRAAAATDAEPIITDYALIAAVGVSASVYDDVAGLQTGVRYYYRLRSRNLRRLDERFFRRGLRPDDTLRRSRLAGRSMRGQFGDEDRGIDLDGSMVDPVPDGREPGVLEDGRDKRFGERRGDGLRDGAFDGDLGSR